MRLERHALVQGPIWPSCQTYEDKGTSVKFQELKKLNKICSNITVKKGPWQRPKVSKDPVVHKGSPSFGSLEDNG